MTARPCFFCGYDLRGVPGASRCPECGKPQHDAREVIDQRALGGRRMRWIAAILGTTAVAGWLLLVAIAAMRD